MDDCIDGFGRDVSGDGFDPHFAPSSTGALPRITGEIEHFPLRLPWNGAKITLL